MRQMVDAEGRHWNWTESSQSWTLVEHAPDPPAPEPEQAKFIRLVDRDDSNA